MTTLAKPERDDTPGPFLANQLRSGDAYELSNGHPIRCLPSSGRHATANLGGGLVLRSDPDVKEAGVDAGYSSGPNNLRAPDIAVGNVPDAPGWIAGAPPLAVEYADTGQNEIDLQNKIKELIAAGTRHIWVVRMVGTPRVEVYELNQPVQIRGPEEYLHAPGILRNPVKVAAFYDAETALESTLRNLLQRKGYADLDAVKHFGRQEGINAGFDQGRTQTLLANTLWALQHRFGRLSEADTATIEQLSAEQLESLFKAQFDFADTIALHHWLGKVQID